MQRVARVTCLILCLGFAVGALAQEKKITKKDLPVPVLSSFQKAYPKATIKGLSTETEEGKTYFEIESVDGKVKRDLLYLADGTVAEIEETVAAADLPAPVKAAVAAKHPKGKIAKVEKVTRGGVVSYDVVLRSGKTNVELSIDPAGKVLKESKASAKKEGKEAKEKWEKN
jgi:hypothetical protein